MEVTCTFCGSEIDADHSYQRVEGWEKKRDRGGANQIHLRMPKDEFACIHCVGKLKRGVDPGQAALL